MSKRTGNISTCQSCGARKLAPILSMGNHPIVQEYLTTKTLHEPETTYPLNLVFCPRCKLLQLDYIVEPKKVFPPDYPYRTGLTSMLVRNFQSLADELGRARYFKQGNLVVDIGSNDGTLLKPFKKKGARVLGVEPTDAAKVANKAGIPTIQDFFNATTVRSILKKYGRAEIITATNVFAHINDTSSLVQNIAKLLDTNGVFVSESQYLCDIVEKLEFDTIYHEHLRFYSLTSLTNLLKRNGFSVIDAERISAAGGSIRVFAKKGRLPMSVRARALLAKEKRAGLTSAERLLAFARTCQQAKRDLLQLLITCKKRGSITALGSPARSNTLLNFCNIDSSLVDRAYEKIGSPKIGLFAPGSHIPVVSEKELFNCPPKYLVILSWHIGGELMKLMRKLGYRGQFIVPLPRPRVLK